MAGAASAEAALAEAALASTVGSDSVVALASIVDSGPAPSPSIAGLASTADSVVGSDSVDLVVDGKVDASRRVDASKL